MAKWQTRLELSELWRKWDADEISLRLLAAEVSAAIMAVPTPPMDVHLLDIADEFAGLAQQDDPDIEDFDDALASLYGWGDTDHRLWVDTSGAPEGSA